MSSVLYGVEKPPFAFSLLRDWLALGSDEFALFHHLLSESTGPAGEALWAGLRTEGRPGARGSRNRVEDVVRVYGLPGMRRHLAVVGLEEWAAPGLPAFGLSSEQYVALCLSGALIGESLAERTGQDPMQGFCAGLFGSIGLLPLANLLRRVHPNAVFPGDLMALSGRVRWEREQVGHDSLEVGGQLLDLWDFPFSVSAAIRGLAYPLLVANGRPLTMLAHLAVRMAPVVVFGESVSALDRVTRKCFETFGLPPSVIAELAEESSALMSGLVDLERVGAVVAFEGRETIPQNRFSAVSY